MKTAKIILLTIAIIIIGALLLNAARFYLASPPLSDDYGNTNAGIANPASVFCEEHGGKLEIVTAADGSQSGNCKLPGGAICEEWAYFKGECLIILEGESK